jgi:hypothetical protein
MTMNTPEVLSNIVDGIEKFQRDYDQVKTDGVSARRTFRHDPRGIS